jgi:hypothetical protein
MGDAFGTSLERTPRTHIQDLFSDIFASALWGGAHSGNPAFTQRLAQYFGPAAGQAPPNTGGVGGATGGYPDVGVVPEGDPTNISGAPSAGGGGLMSLMQALGIQGPDIAQPPTDMPGGAATTAGGGGLGRFLQDILGIPQYGGQMTAGPNTLQRQGLNLAGQGLSSFSPNTGQNIIQQLLGLAGGGGPGADFLRTAGTGLTNLGMTGATPDVASIFQALDNQRRAGLERDVGDIREQFSFGGNRLSSDLMRAISGRQAESEASFLGEGSRVAAQLAPALFQGKVGALSGAGDIGNLLNQLSLGASSSLPGAFQTTSLLPGAVAGQGFNIGEQGRAIEQGGLDRMMQEFLRTQMGLLQPALGYAAGAPLISSPGAGSQVLGAGATALGGLK